MLEKIPIDNLYKFLFIGGISLMAYTIYLSQKSNFDYYQSKIELDYNYSKEFNQSQIDTINVNKYFNNNLKLIEAKREVDYQLLLNSSILSLVLILVGGVLWYFKKQKYHDKLLEIKVRRKLKDIE